MSRRIALIALMLVLIGHGLLFWLWLDVKKPPAYLSSLPKLIQIKLHLYSAQQQNIAPALVKARPAKSSLPLPEINGQNERLLPIAKAVIPLKPASDLVNPMLVAKVPLNPAEAFVQSLSAEYQIPASTAQLNALILASPSIPYPESAIQGRIEGVVSLIVILSAQGHIEFIHVSQSSGDSTLDDATRDFIKNNWRFDVPAPDLQYRYVEFSVSYTLTPQPSVKVGS